MFRREMCAGKIGVEARRTGLAARREEQRNKLLQNRRNVTSDSSEKKVPVPKPKESAAERRARLNQYREMKTRKESELRTERLKTPAFKVGPAPARERTTPSTARKMLNFDFKGTSESEAPSAAKTPAARKGLLFGHGSTAATTSKKIVGTARGVGSGLRSAVKRNLQTSLTSEKGVSQNSQTPRTVQKISSGTQKTGTPSMNTNSGQTTPRTVSTTSRPTASRITPSKTRPLSASKKPEAFPSTSKTVLESSKPVQTPRIAAASRLKQTSATKPTPSGVGAKPTPTKSSTTPLKSIGPTPTPLKENTTPKRTPLATRSRLNLSKQKTETNDATTEEKKSNFTPNKQPTTTLKRAQSSNNLSRQNQPQSSKKPDLVSRGKSPQIATTLKRAQSANNLSRPSPQKNSAKPGPPAAQNKTPQMKLQRSTSASTLTRKALTSSSPSTKTRMNLSNKFGGEPKAGTADIAKREATQKQKLGTRSNSALSSASKPLAMSRIQAAVLKNQAKAEEQKQNPISRDEENNKKWANLMALIQAQKKL